MSDSDDDFVEVSGYQTSDSDWEKIEDYSSGFSSGEEVAPAKQDASFPKELVQSYYRSPDKPHSQHLQDHKVPTLIKEYIPLASLNGMSEDDQDNKARRRSKKAKKLKDARKKQWTKLSLQRGNGAPYDPVEFLGITSEEKTLLSRFGITTIGQLAHLSASDFVSNMDSDNFAIIMDLQERAYGAVTAYVAKTSAQPEIVWGYLYLGDAEVANIMRRGYIDSDALYFVWSPMPSMVYRDQRALDAIIGKETKNRSLTGRYSRYVKVNLSKLCDKYYGRMYKRDPHDMRAQDKWQAVSLMEAAEISQRENLWYAFEAGDDLFSRVCHGSIVIPTGRIPKDCVELDKESSFPSLSSPHLVESDGNDEIPPTAFDDIFM